MKDLESRRRSGDGGGAAVELGDQLTEHRRVVQPVRVHLQDALVAATERGAAAAWAPARAAARRAGRSRASSLCERVVRRWV